ncbi:MAG: hypothetical protein M3Z66_08640 [Chloroflexota bacterium]|nr:hypothetical protein [Chloroflexota bacterium]
MLKMIELTDAELDLVAGGDATAVAFVSQSNSAYVAIGNGNRVSAEGDAYIGNGNRVTIEQENYNSGDVSASAYSS